MSQSKCGHVSRWGGHVISCISRVNLIKGERTKQLYNIILLTRYILQKRELKDYYGYLFLNYRDIPLARFQTLDYPAW